MRFCRFLKEMVISIIRDIRKDFTPELTYTPYEAKVIGNKLRKE